MSITERHRWCMAKMIEAFAPELSLEAVQAFTRQESNLQKFNAFFRGEGPGRLFILYQPAIADGEVNSIQLKFLF